MLRYSHYFSYLWIIIIVEREDSGIIVRLHLTLANEEM